MVAPDGHRVDVGGGSLEMIADSRTRPPPHVGAARGERRPGDRRRGGDPAGGGNLYPNVPPSDVDIARAAHSLLRLGERQATTITLSHFGPTADAEATLADADDALGRLGHAALEGYRIGGRDGIAAAIDRRLPFAATVGNPEVVALWEWLSWDENNILGLEIWAERQDAAKDGA